MAPWNVGHLDPVGVGIILAKTTRPMARSARNRRVFLVPAERIAESIHFLRGQKVMLDADLAKLYRLPTGALIQAVKRNLARFPQDFMFQLSGGELAILKSQTVISRSWGGRRRSSPYAFTEQGVAMLSSVLRSNRAVEVNIEIMRAFVRLRRALEFHKELATKLDAPRK